jgi:hypothetical protein
MPMLGGICHMIMKYSKTFNSSEVIQFFFFFFFKRELDNYDAFMISLTRAAWTATESYTNHDKFH